jgi:thymidylate synthase (FAD)
MSNVSIEFFNIARTQVDRAEVQRWMDYLGADEYEIPSPEVATDPALLIALAAKRCYMAFQVSLNPNLTKVRKDMCDYIDNILASSHGSVCEHSVYTFAIEGVSRVFTGELNRHRAGWAISEGSMRFIRFDKDIPWWMPKSLRFNDADDEDLHMRKIRSQGVFQRAFRQMQENYTELLGIWDMDEKHHLFGYKKKVTSCLRRIIGMGVATGGVWTGNIRALRHVLTMRGDDAAEEEIFHVFAEKIGPYMIERESMLFGDFTPSVTGALVPKYRKV